MIVASVRVQSRVPGFKKRSLMVIGFETNGLDKFKVHIMAEKVNRACNFKVLVKTCPCFFEVHISGVKDIFV